MQRILSAHDARASHSHIFPVSLYLTLVKEGRVRQDGKTVKLKRRKDRERHVMI